MEASAQANEDTSVLVVDEHPDVLKATGRLLRDAGFRVREASTGTGAMRLLEEARFSLVLLDAVLSDLDGREICRRIKADPSLQGTLVMMISGSLTSSDQQADGLDLGADAYVVRPVSNRELLARVQSLARIQRAEETLRRIQENLENLVVERTAELARANESLTQEIDIRRGSELKLQKALGEIARMKDRLEKENLYLQEEIRLSHQFEEILGRSDALQYVLFRVEQVAPTDATVLILGETGTGKELIARAVHKASPRKDRVMVKVNCAALPHNLIESELFGHQKGAFTGAQALQQGRFEVADGTTLFLDEIGELPPELQAKLLRVLQDGEFERLGSSRTMRVDVRVVAATNRNLKQEVARGRFREDLWYRLNMFPVTVPPLRQRRDDIPILAEVFAERFAKKLGRGFRRIHPSTLEAMMVYPWPGNIRELENVIERAVILSQGPDLVVELPVKADPLPEDPLTLEAVERSHILRVLEETVWKIEGRDGAAQVLGINPGTLRSRMKKLGIRRP